MSPIGVAAVKGVWNQGQKCESRPDNNWGHELYFFFMPSEFGKDRRDVLLYQSASAAVKKETSPSIRRAATYLFSDPAIQMLALSSGR